MIRKLYVAVSLLLNWFEKPAHLNLLGLWRCIMVGGGWGGCERGESSGLHARTVRHLFAILPAISGYRRAGTR